MVCCWWGLLSITIPTCAILEEQEHREFHCWSLVRNLCQSSWWRAAATTRKSRGRQMQESWREHLVQVAHLQPPRHLRTREPLHVNNWISIRFILCFLLLAFAIRARIALIYIFWNVETSLFAVTKCKVYVLGVFESLQRVWWVKTCRLFFLQKTIFYSNYDKKNMHRQAFTR